MTTSKRTPAELDALLEGMAIAAEGFYRTAARLGCADVFDEAGFMANPENCRAAVSPVPTVPTLEAAYIGEKFSEIFRRSFLRRPALVEAFCRAAFGTAEPDDVNI